MFKHARKRLLKNAIWNWLGTAVDAFVAFLLLPLLIYRLGNDGYGLWILLGSLTGSFQFLDLGFRSSVGRFVAYYFSLSDHVAISRVLSTATAILTGLGTLAFVCITTMAFLLPWVVEIPASDIDSARVALAVLGIHLGLSLVLKIFDGAMWGLQRFKLLNVIDSAMAISRLLCAYFLVRETGGLIMLAWITLGITLVTGVIKATLSARFLTHSSFGWRFTDRSTALELVNFGIWNFIASLATLAAKTLFPILVGVMLGLTTVTSFAIITRLVNMAKQFIVAATGVLTPHTTTLYANEQIDEQRTIFLQASKYCAIASLIATVGISVLCQSFFQLWVGEEYSHLSTSTAVLAIGSFLPMLATVATGTLQAMASHRCLATFGVSDVLAAVLLGALIGPYHGLTGVCIAMAISGTLFSGLGPIWVSCRLLRIAPATFAKQVLAPAVGVVAVPASLLLLSVIWFAPFNWPFFIIDCVGFSGLCAAFALFFLRNHTPSIPTNSKGNEPKLDVLTEGVT